MRVQLTVIAASILAAAGAFESEPQEPDDTVSVRDEVPVSFMDTLRVSFDPESAVYEGLGIRPLPQKSAITPFLNQGLMIDPDSIALTEDDRQDVIGLKFRQSMHDFWIEYSRTAWLAPDGRSFIREFKELTPMNEGRRTSVDLLK